MASSFQVTIARLGRYHDDDDDDDGDDVDDDLSSQLQFSFSGHNRPTACMSSSMPSLPSVIFDICSMYQSFNLHFIFQSEHCAWWPVSHRLWPEPRNSN